MSKSKFGYIKADKKYPHMVYTIGELREALKEFSDEDQVVVEIHEGERSEDLYEFYVDHMNSVLLQDGTRVKEVRLCI